MAAKKKSAGEVLTLTEVSARTGISMPTLQRYKKLYQARIPSVGKGRKQRYPEEALVVFEEIKQENIGRRGRPRKDAKQATASSAKKSTRKTTARKPAARKATARKTTARKTTARKTTARKAAPAEKAAAESGSNLLTLAEIGRRTGISYPTLSRYVKQHGRKLKSEGTGRARRFYEEAVAVFEELRGKSGRGRKAAKPAKATKAKATKAKTTRGRGRATKKAAAGTDAELAKRVTALEKQLKALERKLSKPVRFKVLPG